MRYESTLGPGVTSRTLEQKQDDPGIWPDRDQGTQVLDP